MLIVLLSFMPWHHCASRHVYLINYVLNLQSSKREIPSGSRVLVVDTREYCCMTYQTDGSGHCKTMIRSVIDSPCISLRTDALTEMASLGGRLSLDCSGYAVPALCYAAFPPCSGGDGGGGRQVLSTSPRRTRGPRGICRDHCHHLLNVACKAENEWAQRTAMHFGTTNRHNSRLPIVVATADILSLSLSLSLFSLLL